MAVAKRQLESVEQKLWQFFKLDTPQKMGEQPPLHKTGAGAWTPPCIFFMVGLFFSMPGFDFCMTGKILFF